MLAKRVLYYGRDEPLPERVNLRAGPLALRWEQGDLRAICHGETEVLRRVYVAIRDRNWGTVPNVLSNVRLDAGSDSFRITFDVENREDDIDFAWQGTITGAADGAITCTLDGVARATFLKNRIGFCVLHPATARGAKARVTHAGGSTAEAELPRFITPDQPVFPFFDMGSLAHEIAPGAWAEVRFDGDLFEMEDQRNWTDASYKIFSTPIRLPYPAEVKAGTRIRQSVTLTLALERSAQAPLTGSARPSKAAPRAEAGLPHAKDREIVLAIDARAAGLALPRLGLGSASHGNPLSQREIDRLAALKLDHLRVDLPLADPGYPARLRVAATDAAQLDVPLHIALMISPEEGDAPLRQLRALLDAVRPRVATWLVYPAREVFTGGSPVAEALALARRALVSYAPGIPFGGGTNADHIFLARSLPPLDAVDFLTFAITPQVHAFDNASLIETLACQADVVASARRLGRGLPVAVSPVTLKPRHNPTATGPEPPTRPGELPPQVDPRQMSLFAAGWTAGSMKHLAQAGASAVTCYETTGWRGVMEREGGSPLPSLFQSLPGGVFPLYHVLADITDFAGSMLPVTSRAPLVADGLALQQGNRLRVVAANLDETAIRIRLQGVAGLCRVRRLDEETAEEAMLSPDEWRQREEETHDVGPDGLLLDLRPFAVATIDAYRR
jgi:D-apionolactonase